MIKKYKRSTIKTTGRIIVIFLFFISIICTLGYTLFNNLYRIRELNNKLDDLKEKEVALVEKEDALEADIKRLNDPLYVSKYVREKYFYSKEGELILRFNE